MVATSELSFSSGCCDGVSIVERTVLSSEWKDSFPVVFTDSVELSCVGALGLSGRGCCGLVGGCDVISFMKRPLG